VSSFWEHGAGPATICGAILFQFLAASDTDLAVLKAQRLVVVNVIMLDGLARLKQNVA
jgi:hypothetical protein